MKTKAEQIADEIAKMGAFVQEILAKGAEATEDETVAAEAAVTEIETLEAKRQKALELERKAADTAALVTKLNTEPVNRVPFPVATAEVKARPKTAAFVAPVVRGQLKAFKGENAAENAYGFGMWFLASVGNQKAATFCRENGIELKTHNEASNSQGAALVPHQFENMLIDLREQYGVFRRNATIRNMTSDTHSDPRRTGGLTAYWLGESDSITDSTKGWDRVQLTAKKLAVLARITSELNEDSVISIADDLANEIAYSFAVAEDLAGFVGDGTSTYGKITGATTALLNLSATRANIAGLVVGAGNAYSELTLANFNDVKARLPQYARVRGAKWFCSSTFYYGVMEKLAVAAGGVTEQGVANGVGGPRFLGDPVEITQAMPSTEANDQVCAVYGNLALGARLGDRRQTTIALSDHSRFAYDEIEIRGTERVDIVVHDVGNASGTASLRVPGPIVGLLTAAS